MKKWFALALALASCSNKVTPQAGSVSQALAGDVVWVGDGLPAGATPMADGGDAWTWVSSSPTPFEGALANQSNLTPGAHQHYFMGATATLPIAVGEKLIAHVYLDPANPPSEVMLQWNDGSWEHRAYWGTYVLGYGVDGTASMRFMGALPAAGQWVRLEVSASLVGLEGATLNGMAFTLYGGRATWDSAGKATVSGASPDGTMIPPASQIVDSSGAVWTIGAATSLLRNGVSVGGAGTMLWWSGGTIYAFGTDNNWHQWNGSGWSNLGPTQPGGTGTSPDGTMVPPASQIVDSSGAVWTIGAATSLLRNGVNVGGAGTKLLWLGGTIYAFGTDNNWHQWTGSSWSNLGPTQPGGGGDVVWVEDALPAGAIAGGDSWNWVSTSPAPYSGALASQSSLSTVDHQHYFYGATATLAIGVGDKLIAYVYLDPANPPSEIMLQWNAGPNDWHRAYWGANLIGYGPKQFIGPLPPTGQWVRLEVPASQVGLEGSTLNGLAFSLYGGRATWDHAGKVAAGASAVCGNGVVNGGEQCDGGTCCTASCQFAASGSLCRGSQGPCDVDDRCTGTSTSCSDAFLRAGVVCDPAGYTCSGSSAPCGGGTGYQSGTCQ